MSLYSSVRSRYFSIFGITKITMENYTLWDFRELQESLDKLSNKDEELSFSHNVMYWSPKDIGLPRGRMELFKK